MHDMEDPKSKAMKDALEELIEAMMALEGKKPSMEAMAEAAEHREEGMEEDQEEAKDAMEMAESEDEPMEEDEMKEKLAFFKGDKGPVAKKSMTVVMSGKPRMAKAVSKMMKKAKYG